MQVRKHIGDVLKLGAIVAIVYLALNWQQMSGSGDDVEAFAQSACIDATEGAFDVTRTRIYDTAKNANGYVVRISVTLANGEPAKVICLTTPQGGVRDITIDVR
jgi:hypothetical protein